MKTVLFAAAAFAFATNVAWAEGPNAVETPDGVSRPVMAGQFGIDSGSERMPPFSGAVQLSPAKPVLADVGSEAAPVWATVRSVAVARK